MKTTIEIDDFSFATTRYYAGELIIEHQDEVHNYPFTVALYLGGETKFEVNSINVTFIEDVPENEEFYKKEIIEKFEL